MKRSFFLSFLFSAFLVLFSSLAYAQEVDSVKEPANELAPTIKISANQPDFRSSISVVGTHFPERQLVSVAICGNEAKNGSLDCDLATSSTVGVTADGEFVTELIVAPPPVACPCVVRAFAFSAAAQTAIELGAFTPIRPSVTGIPNLEIESVHVKAEPRGLEWVGLDDEKTVEVVLVNRSNVKVQTANLVVRGAGEQFLSFDVDLEPGQQFNYEFVQPVHRIGSTTISVAAFDVNGATVTTRVTQKPALLILLFFIVVVLLVGLFTARKLRSYRTASDYD